MTKSEFNQLLNQRIEEVNLKRAKTDISRFIANPKILDVWSKKYYLDLVKHLKMK